MFTLARTIAALQVRTGSGTSFSGSLRYRLQAGWSSSHSGRTSPSRGRCVIWRDLAPTTESIMTDGIRFLKSRVMTSLWLDCCCSQTGSLSTAKETHCTCEGRRGNRSEGAAGTRSHSFETSRLQDHRVVRNRSHGRDRRTWIVLIYSWPRASKTADLLVLLIRWRDLPDDQIKYIVDYVNPASPLSAFVRNAPFRAEDQQDLSAMELEQQGIGWWLRPAGAR